MGKLIVIEGLDGSGKATQAKLLTEHLKQQGMRVKQVSFPDYESDSSALVRMYLNGDFGDKPEDVNAYAASTFYAVDRYASYCKGWKDDYEEGIIIADRYTTSNAIHQCCKLDCGDWDNYLDWLFDFEYRKIGIPAPDIVFYLRVDPLVSQKLMDKRYAGENKKDIHEKDIDYLNKCRSAADYCAEKLGWKVIECINQNEMKTPAIIGRDIILQLQNLC